MMGMRNSEQFIRKGMLRKMPRLAVMLAGFLAVLFVVSPAFAGGAPSGDFRKGTVSFVDTEKGAIEFTDAKDGGVTTFKVSDEVDLKDISLGEKVIVTVEDLDGEEVATDVSKMFISLDASSFAVILFVGFVGGLVSGFIGSGGAFVLTPALMSLGVPALVALASNTCHKFPKALVGAYKRYRYGQIDMKLGLIMGSSAVVGVQIGIWVQNRIADRWGDAGSGLYISVAFVLILVTVGSFVFYDAWKSSRATGEPKTAKLAKSLRKIQIPPMIYLKSIDDKISFWVTVPVGFGAGLLAATIAVGGFVGVPGMMYVVGVSALMASATELIVAFMNGLTGSIKFALDGNIDIRLTLLLLAASLFGVQMGAVGTTYVKGHVIKTVMGTIMLMVAVSRMFAIPTYLRKLDLVSLETTTTNLLDKISFVIVAIALLVGATIILRAMAKGMAESKREAKAQDCDCGGDCDS